MEGNSRPNQRPPAGDWRTWLILAGRGWGKTRTGAETVRLAVNQGYRRIALVGATAADVRDVMVEGESGLLSVFPPDERPRYEPSKRRVTFRNGALATTYSADEPDRLRGPQHDFAWPDELAAWRRPETWDMLQMGLRLGRNPRAVVTTTPRPTRIIKTLLHDPTTTTTRGSTYENRPNLAPAFFEQILKRYEGTRLGRQELEAAILDDAEGALWNREQLDSTRLAPDRLPELVRIVVAIDPAATNKEGSDETGIIVAGRDARGHGYTLDDLSGKYTPHGWATRAVQALKKWNADRIVGETNQGGEMVEHTLRTVDRYVPFTAVHASKGKAARAEPVAALYEQGTTHHVGVFPELEDQLCGWEPLSGEGSPDRLDALVWAYHDLFPLGGGGAPQIRVLGAGRP